MIRSRDKKNLSSPLTTLFKFSPPPPPPHHSIGSKKKIIIFVRTFFSRQALFPLPLGVFILARARKNFSTGPRFFPLLATTDSSGCGGSQIGKGGEGGGGLLQYS